MVNFFPTPTDVTLRKGWTKKSDGITGEVETIVTYPLFNGGYELFAFADTRIWDATTSTASIALTGLSNARWQHVNFSNDSGNYIIACNGVDPTVVYDGDDWFFLVTTSTAQTISSITNVTTTATVTTAAPHGLITGNKVTISGATPSAYNGEFVITVTGSSTFTYTMASNPGSSATGGSYTVLGITGVNSNTFVNVNLFKNRLWFTQKNSMKVWYLDPKALAGAATDIDFGGIARNGGYLQAMGTWTLDAGQGADDYAVFVTSMGEVLVYNGTDPTSDATWALKGVWQLGQTFSRRCFFKWSGDLLLLTQDGLVPLASALQSSRLDPRVNLTDKIYYAVSRAADVYSANFGWQIHYFAKQNMLILNIPVDGGSEQYVMHTITKSWARFTNINADCWEIHNDNMYFGGNGYVGQFWSADSDNGSNINATVQQAYNYFDSRGTQKRYTLVRPIIQTIGGFPSIVCGVNVDFEEGNATGTISFNPSGNGNATWDTSTWDNATWGGATVINKNWQGVTGIGYCASLQLTAASQGITVRWASTDFVMETGGVI